MPATTRAQLLTFGHGRLSTDDLAQLVRGAGIELVVDVRRFPGSRANPAAARGRIEEAARGLDVGYRWDERLGGRRRLTADQQVASPDTWWRVEAFRAYAAWTRSGPFRAAIPRLLDQARARRTAIMCSEAVWWRCHRRLISDIVTLQDGVEVHHLMHDGRLVPHDLSDGAHLDPALGVVWSTSGSRM